MPNAARLVVLSVLRVNGHGAAPSDAQRYVFGQFLVVGNGEAPVRWIGATKNDVATVLLIEFVAGLLECLDCFAARNHWQLHPAATSMTSSRMPGGNGSPCFLRLFK